MSKRRSSFDEEGQQEVIDDSGCFENGVRFEEAAASTYRVLLLTVEEVDGVLMPPFGVLREEAQASWMSSLYGFITEQDPEDGTSWKEFSATFREHCKRQGYQDLALSLLPWEAAIRHLRSLSDVDQLNGDLSSLEQSWKPWVNSKKEFACPQ